MDERHLLFDTATEEVVEATPADLPPGTRITLPHAHELMVLAWIRGAEWAVANAALAVEAYDEANKRRRAGAQT